MISNNHSKSNFFWDLIACVPLLSSCFIHFEKRRYRPGYHTDIVGHNTRQNLPVVESTQYIKPIKNKMAELPSSVDSIPSIQSDPFLITKSNVDSKPSNSHIKHSKKRIELQDSCDVVVLATGERINAIVIEVGEDYIHYKKCDDLKGRMYTVKTKDLDNVTFRNGEYFVPADRVIVDKEKERRKSKATFVMSIVALSVGVLAVVLTFFIHPAGLIALFLNAFNFLYAFITMIVNIKPTRHAPSYRTKFAWIFASVALLLIIISLVLILIII